MTKTEFVNSINYPMQVMNVLQRRRNWFHAMLGWLLLDWFTTKITITPHGTDDHNRPLFRFTIRRWAEDFSFTLHVAGMLGLAANIRKTPMEDLQKGFALSSPKLFGDIGIPPWAVHGVLSEFVTPFTMLTAHLDSIVKDLPDDNVTVH